MELEHIDTSDAKWVGLIASLIGIVKFVFEDVIAICHGSVVQLWVRAVKLVFLKNGYLCLTTSRKLVQK